MIIGKIKDLPPATIAALLPLAPGMMETIPSVSI